MAKMIRYTFKKDFKNLHIKNGKRTLRRQKKYLMDSKHSVAYGKKDKETYSNDEFVKLAFDFINLGTYKKSEFYLFFSHFPLVWEEEGCISVS